MLTHSVCQTPYNPHKKFKYAYNWRRSKRKLSRDIVENVWSHGVFSGGHRCDQDWMFSDWCVLDFDSGAMSLDEAVHNVFCDYQHIIATTRSHRKEKHGIIADRFRVVIPWTERINDPGVFLGNLRHIIKVHDADPICGSLSHSYRPCEAIVSINRDPEAERMEVAERLSVRSPVSSSTLRPLEDLPAWLSPFLLGRQVRAGSNGEQGRGRDLFIFCALKDLLRAGLNRSQAVDFIHNKIHFEQIRGDQITRDTIDRKARYIWRRYHVEAEKR